MRNILFLISVFFLSAFGSITTYAQKGYTLTFDNDDYKVLKKNPKIEFRDSTSVLQYLKEFKNSAVAKGFLLASIDSVIYDNKNVFAYFYLGEKFNAARLKLNEDDLDFLKRHIHVSEKYYTQLDFTPSEIANTLKKTLAAYENNGFPFVKINFKNPVIENSSLEAELEIYKGKEYRWTAINLRGDSSISEAFVSGVLRIKKDDLYSQDELNQISQRIAQINFLSEIKPYEILFTPDGCELFLYLKTNPLSSINGILGLQQNALTNKLSITGDVALRLLNALHKGENIAFNFKSIRDETQSLDAKINVPYLFRTPFGVDGSFKLYKRDSSFLELKSTFGVQYFLKGSSYLKVFYAHNSSNILSGGANNPSFQNLNSTNSNSYGISIYTQRLDYLPNPSKGLISNFSISAGTRTSRSADSSENIKATIYRSEIDINLFIPITKRNILRLANHSETYFAPTIYQNELTRFGGLNTQRGFNEEELFASTLSTFTIEYRFLLDKNSRVFAFFDQSIYENVAFNYFKDTPFGFGTGFSFGTNIGIFTLSYALGSQKGNPILIKNGKIHFGYVAYF